MSQIPNGSSIKDKIIISVLGPMIASFVRWLVALVAGGGVVITAEQGNAIYAGLILIVAAIVQFVWALISQKWLTKKVAKVVNTATGPGVPNVEVKATIKPDPVVLPPMILLLVIGGTFAVLTLTGCVQPATAKPVAEHNAYVVQQIANSYERDLSLLNQSITDRLMVLRQHELTALDLELITNNYIDTANKANTEAFDADIPNPDKTAAVVMEVRLGRATAEAMHKWLRDYAVLLAASNAKPLRDQMLSGLLPMQEFDEGAASIAAAFNTHATKVVALIADATGNATALREFAAGDYVVQEFLTDKGRDAWDWAITKNIKDADKKKLAEALYGELVGKESETP